MANISKRIRSEFPLLNQQISGKALIYLDNAATTQKPKSVIEAEAHFYQNDNANIHRAPHALGERATALYEEVRERVRQFVGAKDVSEIIFTSGTTQSVNLVANSFGEVGVASGDEILTTELEHHSNIVPWQMLAKRKGATVHAARVTPSGEIDLEDFERKLSSKTKIVTFAHVSNALGTIHPIEKLIALVRAKAKQSVIFVDGAQWIAHGPTDVASLDCDFYAFSAHKMFGPTGVGVLYGRKELLEKMPPFLGGGDMIERVSFGGTTFAAPPARFEAGTPNIAGVVALGAAIDFISSLDWQELEESERELARKLRETVGKIPGVKLVGESSNALAITSFTVVGQSPVDVAVRLNQHGIAVRAGHHCCMPLMESLNLPGTVRASASIYNTVEEIEKFGLALAEVAKATEQTPVPARGSELKLQFGASSATTVREAIQNLRELFESVGDANEKQELLMELGASHPAQLGFLRECAPAVKGCLSEVRLVLSKNSEGRLFLASDSNAQIVRGLLSIVERAFSGQLASDILSFGPKTLFTELNLPGFVSVQRRSGLESVLNQIERSLRD